MTMYNYPCDECGRDDSTKSIWRKITCPSCQTDIIMNVPTAELAEKGSVIQVEICPTCGTPIAANTTVKTAITLIKFEEINTF